MSNNPLLEVQDFDELISKARAVSADAVYQPEPFPVSLDERKSLLSQLEDVAARFNAVMLSTLIAISIEKNGFLFNLLANSPQVEIDMSPFQSLDRYGQADYLRYSTADEGRALVNAVFNLWERAKQSQSFFATLPFYWPHEVDPKRQGFVASITPLLGIETVSTQPGPRYV